MIGLCREYIIFPCFSFYSKWKIPVPKTFFPDGQPWLVLCNVHFFLQKNDVTHWTYRDKPVSRYFKWSLRQLYTMAYMRLRNVWYGLYTWGAGGRGGVCWRRGISVKAHFACHLALELWFILYTLYRIAKSNTKNIGLDKITIFIYC